MRYLKPSDYVSQVTDAVLGQLTDQQAALREQAEDYSIETAKASLRGSYDVERAFATAPLFVSGQSYALGVRVDYNGSIYETIVATVSPAVTAPPDGTNTRPEEWSEPADPAWVWTLVRQPRPLVLVRALVDMTLYHLETRLRPGAMSELRRLCFEDAQKTLRDINRGALTLPQLPTATEALPTGVTSAKRQLYYGAPNPANQFI